MYDRRIKIFVILSALLLLLCLLRLTQMQLLPDSSLQDDIAELKRQMGLYKQLKTIRGKILDRKHRIIANDEAQFQLCIDYRLTRFLDERFRKANSRLEYKDKLESLYGIIGKCAQFKGTDFSEIESEIQRINDSIWNRRLFQAWRNNFPDSVVFEKYDDITSVPLSEAIDDFNKKVPNPVERLRLVNKVDIVEMHRRWPLLELKTDDDVFAAQLEFLDVDGVQILPKVHRVYPYGSAAAQTIGWVGRPQTDDKKLFENDTLASYRDDEVCGREDGVEYVCEAILRGRRGELVYDIDKQLVERTQTRFGNDVTLTLDIELQKKLENYLTDPNFNTNAEAPTAAVVIDVPTGDILALVSTPVFDLNRIRYDYADVVRDPNEPLRNRAINKHYPPGSVVKPLILTAGLQTGNITSGEIISCPARNAPKGWPNCWLFNKYSWTGHDDKWQNHARNAIKGSCNIYFSRLADRINPPALQLWLYKFGYGREIPLAPVPYSSNHESPTANLKTRNFRQASGQISTGIPDGTISRFEQLPPLERNERKFFGIGQGNLRATPLQVANAMAAIARGGIYKSPRLFMDDPNNLIDPNNILQKDHETATDLNISRGTLDIIHDGMSAVVNETGGTAYSEFVRSGLSGQGVKVYGKTGSTEKPDHAWFAGFVTDGTGRSIAIAVLVEGGQSGPSDAAPLASDIIRFCIEDEYIGKAGL